MRKNIIAIAVVAGLLATADVQAADEAEIIASGSVCQPATPVDAASIEYVDGRAMARSSVSVACPLPPVPPGHHQVRAELYMNDHFGNWKTNRCRFINAGSASFDEAVRPHLDSPRIGVAIYRSDDTRIPAHVVVCNLRAGQSVYAATTVVLPL